jgi:hypothetical protein
MAIANQVIENLPSISVTLDDITFQLTPGILTVTGSGGHHMLDEVTLSTSDSEPFQRQRRHNRPVLLQKP